MTRQPRSLWVVASLVAAVVVACAPGSLSVGEYAIQLEDGTDDYILESQALSATFQKTVEDEVVSLAESGEGDVLVLATAVTMRETAQYLAVLEDAMTALNDRLFPLEERLVQYRARAGQDLIAQPTAIDSKLARLLNFASMADGPPTQGQRELFNRLSEGVAERAAALAAVEANEFAELMRLAGVVLEEDE